MKYIMLTESRGEDVVRDDPIEVDFNIVSLTLSNCMMERREAQYDPFFSKKTPKRTLDEALWP